MSSTEQNFTPAPVNTNVAVRNGSMTEEEYLDATCSPAVQSCPLSSREQRALNPNCLYQTMEVYRIKRDGTQKLLFTFQAQSRDPGNQVFYSVSASDEFVGSNRAAHQTQLRIKLNGVSGPCPNKHNSNRNWQFNRNRIPAELIKSQTTSELVIYTRTKDVGSADIGQFRKLIGVFWTPNISPVGYYVRSNFCGGAGRVCTLNVYPDVQWEIKLKGTFKDSDENGRANVQGLQFSVKAEYGAETIELTENFQRIVDNVNEVVRILKKVVDFLQKKSKPKQTARDRVYAHGMSESDRIFYGGTAGATDGQVAQGLANSRLHTGFEIEWPEPDITMQWGWKESEEIIYSKKALFKWSVTGTLKFFKLVCTVELLGPALNAIPGAGPFLSRLQKAGAETGLLTVSVKGSISGELKAQITWSQTHSDPASRQLTIGGSLKVEMTVEATLSTKIATGGIFGWQAEFAAGMVGTATTGITASANRELWVASGSELQGAFKINFDGITIQGVMYREYGLSQSVNEDGRASRRTSSEVESTRVIRNMNDGLNRESHDQSGDVGSSQAGWSGRSSSNFTHVLVEESELYVYNMKFN